MGWTFWGSKPLWGLRFSRPIQNAAEVHSASCTMGTGSLSQRSSSRGWAFSTPLPHLVCRLKKE